MGSTPKYHATIRTRKCGSRRSCTTPVKSRIPRYIEQALSGSERGTIQPQWYVFDASFLELLLIGPLNTGELIASAGDGEYQSPDLMV